ncbi:MAG: hypothetical protein ACK56F_20310 [bacterium]
MTCHQHKRDSNAVTARTIDVRARDTPHTQHAGGLPRWSSSVKQNKKIAIRRSCE